MDIQKEMAQYENILSSLGYGHRSLSKSDLGYLNPITQFGFEIWYESQKAARAQAVPEGYVLMPKEPTDEIIEAMNEFDYRNDYSDMDGAYRTIVETLEKAQEDAEREQKG